MTGLYEWIVTSNASNKTLTEKPCVPLTAGYGDIYIYDSVEPGKVISLFAENIEISEFSTIQTAHDTRGGTCTIASKNGISYTGIPFGLTKQEIPGSASYYNVTVQLRIT